LFAGMTLWLLLRSETETEIVAAPAAPSPSEDLIPRASVADATAPAATARVSPALDGFNLSLLLQYESTNALELSRVREYYEALIMGLRGVPGLQLVEDHTVQQVGGPAEFRLTVTSLDAPNAHQSGGPPSEWVAKVSVEVLSGEAAGTVYALGMIGDAWKGRSAADMYTRAPLSGQCASRALMPCTPVDIAERHVMALRKHVFPRDGSLERELEAKFLDTAQPEPERQRLRNDLKSMKMVLSDAMVRESLARLALPLDKSNAYSASERNDLLIILAGQRHKAMVQPLIDLALHDSDVSSRIEAVKLLATDFPESSAVRVALEKLALDPSDAQLQNTAAAMLNRMSAN